MGKEAIVDKILSDAEITAKGIIEEAQSKVDDITAKTAAECYNYTYDAKHSEDVVTEDILCRSATVAELDSKKLVLQAKSDVLDKVFAEAVSKAKSLDDAAYKRLIFGMLESAEDGDVVTVSAREKRIVTAASLKAFADKKGIKLTLNKQLGDFDGGLILSGGGVDKNMTLDVEISLLRDECEAKVAKELFG